MGWVLLSGSAWLLLSVPAAVLIVRAVSLADGAAQAVTDASEDGAGPNVVVDVPGPRPIVTTEGAVTPSRPRDAPTIPGIPAARPARQREGSAPRRALRQEGWADSSNTALVAHPAG